MGWVGKIWEGFGQTDIRDSSGRHLFCKATDANSLSHHICIVSCTNLCLISDVCDVHCPTLDTDSLPMRAKCQSANLPGTPLLCSVHFSHESSI